MDCVTSGASLALNTYCSANGTDCHTAEFTPFSSMWIRINLKDHKYVMK